MADLQPTAIEVTQAVQDLQNSVVLVVGKRTFARVHVRSDIPVLVLCPPFVARLHGFRQDGSSLGLPLIPLSGPLEITPTPDRGKIDDSFLFELPASWIGAGTITLNAEINPMHHVPESTYQNNTIPSGPLTFQPTKTLRVRFVGYNYYDSSNRRQFTTPPEWFDRAELTLRRALPIAQLEATRVTIDATEPIAGNAPWWMPSLREFRDKEIAADPHNRGVLYIGLVNSFGCGADTGVSFGAGGWLAIAFPGCIAHEVGHLLGREHTTCTGTEPDPDTSYPYPGGKIGGPANDPARYYGFEVGDPSLKPPVIPQVIPNTTPDEMSYCLDPTWFSDYTYKGMRDYIQNNPQIPGLQKEGTTKKDLSFAEQATASQTSASVHTEGDFLSVYGILNLSTDSASLEAVSRESQVGEIPPLVPGAYRIRLLGTNDVLLADYPFTPAADAESKDLALIAQVVDFIPGTRRIEIYSDEAGRPIESVPVSAHAPTVSITSRTGGASLPASGLVRLEWIGSDQDGDPLSYTVLYSSDDRATWRVLARRITHNSFVVDSSTLEGTSGAATGYFEVVANDGVFTGFADNGPFSVAGKAPVARITSPITGSTRAYGQIIALEGSGVDLEDGSLDDASLTWSSDRDCLLGTGRLLHPSLLSLGTHTITLKATDSDGNTSTATTVVNVVPGDFDTIVADKTPPAVTCGGPDGAWHASDVSIACTASDTGSGLANPDDASFSISTEVPAGVEDADARTVSRVVCDKAGNCVTVGPIGGNKIDKQAPGITISTPASAGVYKLNRDVRADYGCADGGSGVASCSGDVAVGSRIDTASVGTKTFRVEATDNVGNSRSQSVSYHVIYDFRGFFPPVENHPVLNAVNAGQTVPVKFSLSGDQGLDIFAEGYPKSQEIPCSSPDVEVPGDEPTETPAASGLTYDPRSGEYQYNWKTKRAWEGTCRQLVVKLKAGTFHRANFRFT